MDRVLYGGCFSLMTMRIWKSTYRNTHKFYSRSHTNSIVDLFFHGEIIPAPANHMPPFSKSTIDFGGDSG